MAYEEKLPAEGQVGPAAARYEALCPFRDPFLMRARECSVLTIPALIPPLGWNGSQPLHTPYQSMGARGVNNLASKFLMSLFPPNSPFFRLDMDSLVADQMAQQEKNFKTKVGTAFGKIERATVQYIESAGMRVPVFEGLKHLIVGGNVLLYTLPYGGISKDGYGGLRVFHLDKYVVKRDPSGNVLEIVVKETVSPAALPSEWYENIIKDRKGEEKGDYKTCDLFTHVKRVDGAWKVYQEVHGVQVPESRGSYPLDKSPWMPLRFTRIDGEDYGRGYVEEYLGDLSSLEGLSQAIVEGAAAAAKLLILVNPNGTTRKDTIEKAPNGAIREGNAADVTLLHMEKYADFRVAKESITELKQDLARAFLLNSSIQRSGERVTAEEIRYMAAELEDALGGVYSILSQELQLPLLNRIMFEMQRAGKLPRLPKGSVKPTITTGLEALGRGHDLNKLNAFVQTLNTAFGPETTARTLHPTDFAARTATALGIETDGLVKTKEEVAAEMQQAQVQGLIEKLGPNAVNAFGKTMEKQQDGEAPAPAA